MPLQRGLHDEAHAGEIDPGVQEIWHGSTLVGYVWVNRHPDNMSQLSQIKYVLLSDLYPTPGCPNPPSYRNPDVTLQFKWDSAQMPLAQAQQKLKTAGGTTFTFTEVYSKVLP